MVLLQNLDKANAHFPQFVFSEAEPPKPSTDTPLRSTRRSSDGIRLRNCELQCHSLLEQIMAANQLVQARIDGAIKTEAAAVLAAMGLTVSDAVRLMLTKVAKEHALPFDPLIPNATTIAAIKEARAGKLSRAKSIADLKAGLHAGD